MYNNLTDDLDMLRTYLYKNIRFKQEYYDVVEYCISTFLNGKYNAVHLRLEDDWINYHTSLNKLSFQDCSNLLIHCYKTEMSKMFFHDDTIYLATHLMKSPNKNNYIIDDLKQIYPKIVYSVSWRENTLI